MKPVFVAFSLLAAAGSARADTIPELFKRVRDSVVVVRAVEPGGLGPPGWSQPPKRRWVRRTHRCRPRAHRGARRADRRQHHRRGRRRDTQGANPLLGAVRSGRVAARRAPMKARPAVLGDSSAVQVGDEVIVVGAPLGMSHTLSVGHQRPPHRPHDVRASPAWARRDASDGCLDQPRNSGGPMFDMNGQVIGIVSHIIFGEAGAGGLGFVVTSTSRRSSCSPAATSGRAWRVTRSKVNGARLPVAAVARIVQRVAQGSPAEKIGRSETGAPRRRRIVPRRRRHHPRGGRCRRFDSGVRGANSQGAQRDPPGPLRAVVLRGGRRIELEWVPAADQSLWAPGARPAARSS